MLNWQLQSLCTKVRCSWDLNFANVCYESLSISWTWDKIPEDSPKSASNWLETSRPPPPPKKKENPTKHDLGGKQSFLDNGPFGQSFCQLNYGFPANHCVQESLIHDLCLLFLHSCDMDLPHLVVGWCDFRFPNKPRDLFISSSFSPLRNVDFCNADNEPTPWETSFHQAPRGPPCSHQGFREFFERQALVAQRPEESMELLGTVKVWKIY